MLEATILMLAILSISLTAISITVWIAKVAPEKLEKAMSTAVDIITGERISHWKVILIGLLIFLAACITLELLQGRAP